jgi:hypothetical protein
LLQKVQSLLPRSKPAKKPPVVNDDAAVWQREQEQTKGGWGR